MFKDVVAVGLDELVELLLVIFEIAKLDSSGGSEESDDCEIEFH